MIRTIIIDDEPLAIEALEIILRKRYSHDVDVIATSNSPLLGKSLIEQHHPDLVFLDVEMPGLSGIDLVRSFAHPTFKIVFITAFDAYAVEAFRLCAIDYLLKPIEADEITAVIDKIKNSTRDSEQIDIQIQKLENILSRQLPNAAPSRLGIAMADKIVFINVCEIVYFEAAGAYTKIYLNDGKKIISSKPLGDFESQLANSKFFRIHHSTIINLDYIKEFQKLDGGYVIMQNNQKLKVSHRKRKDFLSVISNLIV